MVSNNGKKTCFYCKYEISKYNKSAKSVKFNGKLKEICKNCNKKKHKTLEIIYEKCDVQCKICKKPALYKKCIACSICDHFYHGKCINLNKDDIFKTETICGFYMCTICSNDTLPNICNTETHKVNKIVKQKLQQCFTCVKSIEQKQSYPNKHIVYDGIVVSLCQDCSQLGLNIPVRNKSLIEFQDCSICQKLVKYEAIFCDACQHLVHPYCNGINKQELETLSTVTDNWYCLTCNLSIFPNHIIQNSIHEHTKTVNLDRKTLEKEYKTHTDCSVCFKKVTGNETLACSTCNHWLHKKCIGYFKNRVEYQQFLQYYSTREWECPICMADKLPFTLLDNRDFFLLLLDIYDQPTYINKTNFKEVYMKLKRDNFLKLPINYNSSDDKYLDNIDPDTNFYANDTCNYTISTDDINVKSPHDLAMMTFNIRSLKKNFESFTSMLSKMKSKIHIICLTESWLGPLDNIKDFHIDGYHTPLHQNRLQDLYGGGVVTYIHKDIPKHKYAKHLSFVDEYNHCLATEITINNKTTTFLNIYRSPNSLNNLFLDKFDKIIESIKSKRCYVLGDMNYNLINLDKHNNTAQYYNNLMTASFKPLILKPTRITDTNSTLIDHIWTNDLNHTSKMKSHILVTDITDHLPCITVVSSPGLNLSGYRTIKNRNFSDDNRLAFNKRIEQAKDILAFHVKNKHEPSIDTKFNNYFDHITRIYNDCFPLVTKRIHMKSFSKPWITLNVQKLIDKKNKRFSIKRHKNTDSNKHKYKTAKFAMDEAIEKEKTEYYKKLLDKTSNNNKKRWSAIRQIINRKKTDETTCTIADETLGKYYEAVAPNLAEELPKITKDDIPASSKKVLNGIKLRSKCSFAFKCTSEREIYEALLKLDISKGPGIDNLDVKTIKSIAHIISPHLATIFNQCIEEGTYPQCFKIAKCIPVYKGSPLDPSLPINFRPISILTAINKTLERILHSQLSEYLEDNNLLPNFQYGYRKHHNTSQAILDFTNYINKQTSNKQITIAIFMDLSKAFDTVDRLILQKKLTELGLNENSTSLINSYMSNRKFCMQNNMTYYNLIYGVPQGSILGPLLFIMYTYDMINITKENKVIVYADDTTVLVSGKSLTEAKQHCNDILTRFYHYFTLNKLSINSSKTKYMIYKPLLRRKKSRKLLCDTTNTELEMEGSILEQVKSIRFLGVIINDQLQWNDHKQYVYRKICKSIGLIYKCKHVLDENECINMYKTFIQPYFLYAIEVWGHTVQSSTDILVHLQSKIARIIFNCKRSGDAWMHSNGRLLHITELYERVIKKLCLKHHMELLPSYFTSNNMPCLNITQLQNRITRITLDQMYNYTAHIKGPNNCFMKSCYKSWNSLPIRIKMLPYTEKNNALKEFNKFLLSN